MTDHDKNMIKIVYRLKSINILKNLNKILLNELIELLKIIIAITVALTLLTIIFKVTIG